MGKKAVFLLLLKREGNSFVECATAQAKEVRMKTIARQQVSFDIFYFIFFMFFIYPFIKHL